MTIYEISFITDNTNAKYVEIALKTIYEGKGKVLDYLKTKNVSLMLVSVDRETMVLLRTQGIDIHDRPKIMLS